MLLGDKSPYVDESNISMRGLAFGRGTRCGDHMYEVVFSGFAMMADGGRSYWSDIDVERWGDGLFSRW